MSPWTYYWLSVLVLAALLFWPAAKLVWVLSVRRLERKLGQALSAEERLGQRNRAPGGDRLRGILGIIQLSVARHVGLWWRPWMTG